ncbi:hypothetical protein Csa_009983 [Cucumis sativus]|uniref:Uncharacterized protein n=1 Tax=Cucumis sativus TaxID=3659 RepID=A0A0A0L3V1_CUCSA|nr:hypothetical protein Csa_009983 [Cucumis sativus]
MEGKERTRAAGSEGDGTWKSRSPVKSTVVILFGFCSSDGYNEALHACSSQNPLTCLLIIST